MGKLDEGSKQNKPKMSDIISQRTKSCRGSNSANLKRSKSVRASLRSIGNKFLHQKQDNFVTMQRSPSLSSLKDTKLDFKRNYFSTNLENVRKDYNYFDKQPVETILKTPQEKVCKSQLAVLGFKREFLKNKDRLEDQLMVSTPPPLVAPKAAAILQIPIKENCEPVCFRGKSVIDGDACSRDNKTKHVEGFFGEKGWFVHRKEGLNRDVSETCETYCVGDDLERQVQNGFNRNTLRLSITSKRKTSIFHSST